MSENTYHRPDKLEDIPDELKVPEGHVLLCDIRKRSANL